MPRNVTEPATAEPSSKVVDFPTEEPAKFHKRFRRLNFWIGGLILRYFHVLVVGAENLPEDGGTVVAANHQSVIDSFIITAVLARLGYTTRFLAKASYGDKKLVGWFMRFTGQILVNRLDHGHEAESSLDLAVRSLGVSTNGKPWNVGVHTEGTRSPDGKVHKGRTGAARIAMRAGVSITPIGVLGTEELSPKGKRIPRRGAVALIIGKPIYPSLESNQQLAGWLEKHGLLRHYAGELEGTKLGEATMARLVTEYITRQLVNLSHREYANTTLDIKAR
jgi:1-acyl-sn-glycerol-3-phosphate acyltransferase